MMRNRARYPVFLRALRDAQVGVSYVRALLRPPIERERAASTIRARTARREERFLEMMERTIFAFPGSAYRPLLEAAGYDFGRVRALVGQRGVEESLRQLSRDGVYVSIEEFKGSAHARRGDRVFRFDERAFRNPLAPSGLQASSGGTRSRGILTTISFANHRLGAEHLAAALDAYELWRRPIAVWLAVGHGASLWSVLALAAMSNPPRQWFSQLARRVGGTAQTRAYEMAIRFAARAHGVTLPSLTYVPIGQEPRILEWIAAKVGDAGCGIITTPSSALRLALAARRNGVKLPRVTFITIAEPLTQTKLDAIQAAGASAFSSLGFTEFGRATYGCASPAGPDDTHLCKDAVAVIQRRRAVDQNGTEVDALLFTALGTDSRRTLLNMETGDYATLFTRQCGCPLESLGWTDHLMNIRSFEKLNAEGRLFFGSNLIRLVEEVLPHRFGGDPTDYQLVEREDGEGFTRLEVLVHPRLGPIDEPAALECVEQNLDVSVDGTAVWNAAGTVVVRRAEPMLTKAGKLMPLHHLGQDLVTAEGSR
jgi:hypothetical protein